MCADLGYVDSEITGLPAEQRPVHKRIWQHVLKLSKMRFGRCNADQAEVSQNMAGALMSATTDAVANTEFSVAHNLDAAPYLLVPVLPLDIVNAEIVRLKVTRAADSKRIYLSSPETSRTVFFFLEG